jgi:hypothetical protein
MNPGTPFSVAPAACGRWTFGRRLAHYAGSILLLMSMSQAVRAQVSVAAPINGAVVNSPVYLQAQSSSCSSQTTGSMAYSVDDGTDTIFDPATSISANVTMTNGTHTLHVKAWGNQGALCMQDLSLSVGNGVTVTTPINRSAVSNPFNLQAQAPSCGGQGTSAMAYSFDSQADTVFNGVSSINTSASTTNGQHLLRVKAWGNTSAFCETDLTLNVSTNNNGLTPPSNASQYASIETADSAYNNGQVVSVNGDFCSYPYTPNQWQTQDDCGSAPPGDESGSTSLTSTYTHGGASQSRQFTMSFGTDPSSGKIGGERWFDSKANVSGVHNFLYDLWVYFPTSSDVTNMGNLELDINHSLGDGFLYVLGVQCFINQANGNGVWQVSPNGSNWNTSNATCNNSQFSAGTWHHVQIQSHHDDSGNITYDAVAVDGSTQSFSTCYDHTTGNATSCTGSRLSAAWDPTIGPNFQLDGGNGHSSGSITVYANQLTIYFW